MTRGFHVPTKQLLSATHATLLLHQKNTCATLTTLNVFEQEMKQAIFFKIGPPQKYGILLFICLGKSEDNIYTYILPWCVGHWQWSIQPRILMQLLCKLACTTLLYDLGNIPLKTVPINSFFYKSNSLVSAEMTDCSTNVKFPNKKFSNGCVGIQSLVLLNKNPTISTNFL